MSLPLFQRPGTVVFLDDDPDYLEMLAMVMPRHWRIKLFVRPAQAIHYLQQEPPFWEADAWHQQQLVEQWQAGKPLIPQLLAYWAKYTERYALSRVCVVDYSMPGTDGLQVLSELGEWSGSRVLLTGQADEQVAVRAFNRGLIEQFIPKQAADISRRLIDAVEQLLATPNARHAQIWRGTLRPEQTAALRPAAVQRALVEFAHKHWVEHVLIGEPFGLLGMSDAGAIGWLQLEPPEALEGLAEMAQTEGLPERDLAEIRAGRKLVDLELRQALGQERAPRLLPATAFGDALWGALFPVTHARAPDPANSYARWLSRQEARAIEE